MNKSTVIAVVVGVLIGVVFAPKIHSLPLLDKLPTL